MALKHFIEDVEAAVVDHKGRPLLSIELKERVIAITQALYYKGMPVPELKAGKYDYMDKGCVFNFYFKGGVIRLTQFASGKIVEEAWASFFDKETDCMMDRKFKNNLTKMDLELFMKVVELSSEPYDEDEDEWDEG